LPSATTTTHCSSVLDVTTGVDEHNEKAPCQLIAADAQLFDFAAAAAVAAIAICARRLFPSLFL
jgi:hypothetical protein